MKKAQKIMFAASAVILALTVSSYASINIRWVGSGGFLQNNDVDGLLADGGFAYAQLVWTTGSAPGSVSEGAVLEAQEVVLWDRWISSEFAEVSAFDVTTANSGISYAPGNIFARIFGGVAEQDTSLIVEGTHYFWGPVVPLVETDAPPATPQIYNMQRDQSSFGFGDPVGPGFTDDAWNNTVIPEPTVLAMLGFGGLVLTIRRRFIVG